MVEDAGGFATARLAWLVDALNDPSSLTVEAVEETYDVDPSWTDWTPEREIWFIGNGRHAASRPFEVERTTTGAENDATAILVGADDKRWSVTVWVGEGEPHRIERVRTVPAPPDGLDIRLATESDTVALAELERKAPIRLGTDPITSMTFDHGDDYFAPARLMDEVTIYVGEIDGELHGVYCGAVQPVQIEGEPKRLFLEHHVRINPNAPRGGVFWALCNFGRDRYAHSTDSIAFYVAEENFAVRKFVDGTPSWSEPVFRALIPCTQSGAEQVRSAVPSDAKDVATTLNACHGDSTLFVPYSADSLRDRLGRDSAQYGWSHMLVNDGAVVGVGRDIVGVTHECEGTEDRTVRATAFDHGFRPGHEDDYRDLLRAAACAAGERGATHLAVYTSEHAPTHDVLRDLAEHVERFDFWAFAIPEPATLPDHGMYVDPVYF